MESTTIIKEEIVKDGIGFLLLKWSIDTTKPKCYKEGHSYKFNSELVERSILN